MNISFPDALVDLQNAINRKIEEKSLNLSSLLISLREEAGKTSEAQKLLESLVYPSMKIRESAIEIAHSETLGWVFDDEETMFVNWLANENGVYWISGLVNSLFF